MNAPWSLVFPEHASRTLLESLFPGDGDEHGAVITAGRATSPRGTRLLVRDVLIAKDGEDYVSGKTSYRTLKAEFIREKLLYCRDQKLAYLAVHCHGGTNSVGFSSIDFASHERGYPALRDIAQGQIVGGLVFAPNAVAGDLWLPDGARVPLRHARMLGRNIRNLYPSPPPRPPQADAAYDRQARLFGDAGQEILRSLKVGIIGAGGVGALLVQKLAHLGVGQLVVADPERIEISNLPRVVGCIHWWDALTTLTKENRPRWLGRLGERLSSHKVNIARRVARQANPHIQFEGIIGDCVDPAVAERFTDCDYLFLAADHMQARLVFNALVHQYLIPGAQVGAKVRANKDTGDLEEIFCVYRPVFPGQGCLWCNGFIPSSHLQEEALSTREREEQRYVDDPSVKVPSVITLNATAAGYAANDFLFTMLGMKEDNEAGHRYVHFFPRKEEMKWVTPRKDLDCIECGRSGHSRLARGDRRSLPVKG